MLCWNLHQAHLQEVGFIQIQANHVRVKGLRQLVWPLDDSQGPPQLHGHNPRLMCVT
jgi:hypothetical protein